MEIVLTGVEQRKDEEEVEREADEVADGSLGDRTNRVTLHDGDQNFRQLFSKRYHLRGHILNQESRCTAFGIIILALFLARIHT